MQYLLEKNNITLTDLEKSTGLSYQQLWNIKHGKTTKISFDTIGRLIEAFKCTPNDLFEIKKYSF
ncbi:MAG: helix-turn-helix transcriptional regulator [Candidatus Gracilibacteria bacterium]|nr:helix-turn-helix transcriptional regulator [Candidatus Gracilibacteria bacterium]